MLRVLALLIAVTFSTPTLAAMDCDTTTDSKIQEAINSDPTRLVRMLDGQSLSIFLSAMTNHGYMNGTLTLIDRIYIVDAGKKPGYTTDNVWLFFMQDGCLIASIPATKSIIVDLLP